VDIGSPQKMRPSKEIERFHDSTQHESALEQIHVSWKHEFALGLFARTFGRKTGFHFS
jgi:hypothetical protein